MEQSLLIFLFFLLRLRFFLFLPPLFFRFLFFVFRFDDVSRNVTHNSLVPSGFVFVITLSSSMISIAVSGLKYCDMIGRSVGPSLGGFGRGVCVSDALIIGG